MVDKKIEPKSHPSHYMMHKYWGRKAHNVISEYIKHFTNEGDVVLDPFMGSGGVVIEANKLKRKSIGVDLNPTSIFIVKNTLSKVNLNSVKNEYDKIINSVPAEIKKLFYTKDEDGNLIELDNAIWEENKLIRIKTKTKIKRDANEFDLDQVKKAKEILELYESLEDFYYPKNKMLDYVKRNGKTHIHQLFSDRNILACAYLYKEIKKIKNNEIKNILLMAFTSMLPNVSKMIPGNKESVTGKSGWQISKFWVPNIHTEKNVFDSFKLRFDKIIKGKLEVKDIITDTTYRLENRSSENLDFIKDESIDYIFTDPPYGESISYFGLSMFWNSWLEFEVDYDSEIIYDPYRNKRYEDYSLRLDNVYSELYRVLKTNKTISFTFHNRSLKFWKIILDSCIKTGFELKNITWQPQAVSSGTQGINRKNTLKGDFVYNFIKVKKKNEINLKDVYGIELILAEVKKYFKKYEFIETTIMYEKLIPFIVNKRAYLDENNKIIDLDKLLNENYEYVEIEIDGGKKYGWKR